MNFAKLAAATAASVGLLALSSPANASLYLSTYTTGTVMSNASDCDDCSDGPISLGAGQSINFFGTTYNDLFVGSNGYVTFGSGASSFSPSPLNVQTVAPMIAGLFTDLDSRSDAASNVYVDSSVLGQLIVTWSNMGHFPQNYGVRNTFQLVIRSDQYGIPSGQGQVGFFYDSLTDGSNASAGFGDGLAASNTGEVAFYNGAASGLSGAEARWYTLDGGTPTSTGVPEPASLGLLGLGLMGVGAARRKRA